MVSNGREKIRKEKKRKEKQSKAKKEGKHVSMQIEKIEQNISQQGPFINFCRVTWNELLLGSGRMRVVCMCV